MSAVWMRARAELRSRWRALLGLALILGIIGGAAVAAAAGARRTMSAYPRFLQRFNDQDIAVSYPDVGQGFRAIDALRAMPEVRSVDAEALFGSTVRTATGRLVRFPNAFVTARIEEGIPSVKVLAGRLPDPEDRDRVVVTYAAAERLDLGPGDRVDVTIEPLFGPGDTYEARDVEVAAVIAVTGSFESATGFAFPMIFSFTPAAYRAFTERVPPAELHVGVGLRDPGAGTDRILQRLEQLGLPPDTADHVSVFTPGVQALNRVPATALWLLAGALGIAGLAVTAQALTRESYGQAHDQTALHAVGFTRTGLVLVSHLRVVVVASVGAGVGVIVAVAASPLTPAGIARIAEPDPGIAIDATILGLGAAVIVVGLMLFAAPGSWRAAGSMHRSPERSRSVVAEGIARTAAPASVVAGVRFALTPGGGRTRTPVRTAVLGTMVALAAVVASLVFVQSLARLRDDATLSGYTWDAGLIPPETSSDAITDALEDMPFVATSWRGTVFETLGVARPGGQPLQLQTVSNEGPPPPVMRGRAPTAEDELALDPRTVRQFGLELGDEVLADRSALYGGPASPRKTFELVGVVPITAFPFVGENAGQGVVLTPAAARRADPEFLPESVFVRFEPGADFDRAVAQLEALPRELVFSVVTRNQAASVRNVDRLGSLPPGLAALLGVLGLALLAHALTSTIQRRRSDLAVLRTIGFVSRQLRATVAWQASTLVLLALLIGVPLGAIAGRWGWRLFAEHLSVVPVAVAPVWLWILIPAATIVVANAMATLPARAAARTQPAVVLRSE